jgi:hypothetical protein
MTMAARAAFGRLTKALVKNSSVTMMIKAQITELIGVLAPAA